MKHYFVTVTTYAAKNSAQKVLTENIANYQHTLVDEITLVKMRQNIASEIKQINERFTRCQDIVMMSQFYPSGQGAGIIWADGIFHLSITKVNQISLTENILLF